MNRISMLLLPAMGLAAGCTASQAVSRTAAPVNAYRIAKALRVELAVPPAAPPGREMGIYLAETELMQPPFGK